MSWLLWGYLKHWLARYICFYLRQDKALGDVRTMKMFRWILLQRHLSEVFHLVAIKLVNAERFLGWIRAYFSDKYKNTSTPLLRFLIQHDAKSHNPRWRFCLSPEGETKQQIYNALGKDLEAVLDSKWFEADTVRVLRNFKDNWNVSNYN